jgi:hypothetical protein
MKGKVLSYYKVFHHERFSKQIVLLSALLTPEKSHEMIANDGKNNGSVLTGKGSFYSHTNHFSRRPLDDLSNYHHPSPGFDGKGTSTSLITLVPSSSTTSLASKQRHLQKTGSVLRWL